MDLLCYGAQIEAVEMMKRKANIILIAMLVMSLFASAGGVWAFNFEKSVDNGADIYSEHCASCHGAEGDGGVGPAVNDRGKLEALGLESFKHSVEDGIEGTTMPAWSGELSHEEIEDVVHYIYFEWADFVITGPEMWPWEITYVVMGIIWALMGMYYVIRV